MAFQHRQDIAFDAQPAKDRGLLRQVTDAEAAALEHRQMRDRMAIEADFALVGPDQAHDHGEDCGLAGPVRPQQPDGFAAPHRDAHIAHHGQSPEALGQTMCHEPPGLVDAGLLPAFVHCEVNTPVTRPDLPPENTDVLCLRSSVSSGPFI